MNVTLWNDIIENGKAHQSHPETNVLSNEDTRTIIATMDFFGASSGWIQLTRFDLLVAKYRVFDWLGMCIMGRNSGRENNTALKVLVHAFITAKYDEKKFIENLRRVDYDVVTDWEKIEINTSDEEEIEEEIDDK